MGRAIARALKEALACVFAVVAVLPGCGLVGSWQHREPGVVVPINFGAEWDTVAGRPTVSRCREAPCITFPDGATVRGAIVQLTNYQPGHVALFVLLASADGTPWAPGTMRLHSAVVTGVTPAVVIPGPYLLPSGWHVWWAIDVYAPDGLVPHVEHQTTLQVDAGTRWTGP